MIDVDKKKKKKKSIFYTLFYTYEYSCQFVELGFMFYICNSTKKKKEEGKKLTLC